VPTPRDEGRAGGDAGTETPDAAPLRIDEVLSRLEHVVEQLEAGDLPLEQALARFEEGVALARRGGAMLDALEERVELLLADGGRRVPFQPEPGEDDDGGA
jgi:exodeoxyribonuclease VII small subunit